MPKVIMIVGPPASGKSSLAKEYIDKNFVHLNRDLEGVKTSKLIPKMEAELRKGNDVVLDNTFPTVESRAVFIKAAHSNKATVHCDLMTTSIEDCQINALYRMIEICGKILFDSQDIADATLNSNPNFFPPAALFSYRNKYVEPTLAEGFQTISLISFNRKNKGYTNKGAFLDYDQTLRDSKGEQKYPVKPEDIQILPGRSKKLKTLQKEGYILVGVSNQSGVHKKILSFNDAVKCFEETNKRLGIVIDFHFCPHSSSPIKGGCYCRKPQSGMGVYFIHKYKLDVTQSFMVGDQTSDKTFATRLGLKYYDQEEFFK